MPASTAKLEKTVAEEQERHELLAELRQEHGLEVDGSTSLDQRRAEVEEQRRNEETKPPERELEQPISDPDTSDEEGKQEAPPPDPEGRRLFNASDYEREDLAISKVDGNQVDRIAIKFAGEVFLDRSDPADVALYNRLKLGADVTLMIEGRCNATGAKGATDREGDLDVVVGQKSVKVGTVYIPAIPDE